MAQIYVAGPAEIHVAAVTAGALSFLGWSESGVRLSINPEWDDVPADIAGSRMPADVQYMGETATVSCDLKVWNERVLQRCQSRGFPVGGAPGTMLAGHIGELMVAEGAAYRLLVYSPYSVKPAMANAANGPITPAYNFFKAWLAGPDDINPLGTRAKKVRVVFRAVPHYDPRTGAWVLYNYSLAGKPPAA